MSNRKDENRCAKCHALLFIGKLVGEIKCWRCKYVMKFFVDKKTEERETSAS